MIILTWEKKKHTKKKKKIPPRKGGRRRSKNLQQFATAKLICYNQQEKQHCKTTLAIITKEALQKPMGHPLGHILPQRSLSLTLPKCHLATKNNNFATLVTSRHFNKLKSM